MQAICQVNFDIVSESNNRQLVDASGIPLLTKCLRFEWAKLRTRGANKAQKNKSESWKLSERTKRQHPLWDLNPRQSEKI